jgi:hypothetical protein
LTSFFSLSLASLTIDSAESMIAFSSSVMTIAPLVVGCWLADSPCLVRWSASRRGFRAHDCPY